MDFNDLGADSLFFEEFCGRHEEVVEEPPVVFVEVVEATDNVGVFKPAVAEPLTDVGPVFSLDVGVVVFEIGS